ncbi:MAG: N-acetylmuramoyl-L-alanine amidase [Clostridia bacterium]|nr:N-acetylmuramoyl-L-alanine amidase [Clostridia bacterium]
MFFYTVNLKKHRFSLSLAAIALILIVSMLISSFIVTEVYGEELFIEASKEINNSKIVIVDAGHGGEDGGASGADGTLEKDLNLQLALEVGARFEEAGYAVVYTRTDDRLLYLPEEDVKGIRKISDLKNRCKVAEMYPDSVFVSIHMNSFGDSKYSGLQVYYSIENEASERIARAVQEQVRADVQPDNNRKIKAGKGIYLLENISNPAVLVECGFLTNAEECKKLSEKEYQKQLSFSIVCGIINSIEN